MKRLDRSTAAAPPCLTRYRHGRDEWSALATTRADYDEVVNRLEALQGKRCAYCESDLSRESGRPHVEHFRQRARAPELTFVWGNLFRSCTHAGHCGKHKDAVASSYLPGDLIKPDEDEPRRFLKFLSDGSVEPRVELPPLEGQRASETIRVFALDCARLRGARRAHLAGPWTVIQQAMAAGFSDGDFEAFLRSEATSWSGSPFSSAILDVFGL